MSMAFVLTDRNNWEYRGALIGMGLGMLAVKIVVIDRCHIASGAGRRYGLTLLGLMFIATGSVLFCFDVPGPYWITHSFWHILVFVGTAIVVYGYSRKRKRLRPQNRPPTFTTLYINQQTPKLILPP